MDIETFKQISKNRESDQKHITKHFTELTDSIPILKQFRDLVEKEVYGFGERAFLSMHKMILDSFEKNDIKFLEIGVYKGQLLSLYRLLESICAKSIDVYGITPLDSSDGHIESDYLQNIHDLHDIFKLKYPIIIKGLSQDGIVIDIAGAISPFDVIVIDGSHQYEDVKSDLENYSKMVSVGGYLIMDDSANDLPGAYWGEFWGIAEVTKATVEFFINNSDWEYIGNVVHNKIYKRIK